MTPEAHLLEVHKVLHTINDRQQLARIQDQLLSLNLMCAHWLRSLDPGRTRYELTAGHVATSPDGWADAQRKLLEGASFNVLDVSLSVKLQPEGGVVTRES